MKETWKDIPGFEGLYQISNQGRLKSFKTNSDGRILKATNKKGDYFRVVLQGAGKKRKSKSLHRLVAEAFIPNPCNLPEVNHIDGNRQNNNVNNLEWCSRAYNVRHSLMMHPDQITPMIKYNKTKRPKAIIQMTKDGAFIKRFENGADASRETGICHRNILQAANGTPNGCGYKRKTAGGFIWAFESEVIKE